MCLRLLSQHCLPTKLYLCAVLEWFRSQIVPGDSGLPRFCLLVVLLALPAAAPAASRVESAPVPAEMRSTAFILRVNGRPVDVAHAAASLEYASFDLTGPVEIEITATEPDFWDAGVDIEPWRLGLRATHPPEPRPSAFACRARPSSPSRGPAIFSITPACFFSLPARRHRRRPAGRMSRSFRRASIARASTPKAATPFTSRRAHTSSAA